MSAHRQKSLLLREACYSAVRQLRLKEGAVAGSCYGFEEAKIAKRLKEGRCAGVTYFPWLTVQDVGSESRPGSGGNDI